MPFKFFSVPVSNPDPAAAEINRFLARHRILHVDRQWVPDGRNSAWHFCVDYIAAGSSTDIQGTGRSQAKIDYKEVLEEKDFQVFAKLRAQRKEISEAEGVPLFAVFTNEQLAEMARKRPRDLGEFRTIAGIGEKKAGRYGARFLALIREFGGRDSNETHQRSLVPNPGVE